MKQGSSSRRDFITKSSIAAAGLWLPTAAAHATGYSVPDLVVYNAKIYTVDDLQPTAQAIAVKNGRFVAIGDSTEIRALAGADTKQLDAGGATIVPGFNDAHIHTNGHLLLYEVVVGNPFEVELFSIDTIVERLRKRAQQTPPGFWVRGFFYDDTKSKDGRLITRLDLDQVSTEHPVCVHHRGGHTAFYNSKAFELAGVTKDTPNPPGGEYFHDASGLSGRVAERAKATIDRAGKREEFTPQQMFDRAEAGGAHFSKVLTQYGVTSVQAGLDHVGAFLALQKLRQEGRLRHRVNVEVSGKLLDAMIENNIQSGFGDEWIRIGATSEYPVDGSLSERTARVSRPYPGIKPDYYGISTRPQDEVEAWALRVHKAGIRLNCHANGDVAIASVLTAYEKALSAYPVRDPRPKITHCAIINEGIIKRMKAINAVPAVFTSYLYFNSDKFKYYGDEIMRQALAFRSFLDAGIHVAAGSDYGPGPFNALMGIQGMVTRKGWDNKVWGLNQKISVAEALKIYTLNGAYCSLEERDKGSITNGKVADFVLLADDPFTVDQDAIVNVKVLKTFTGGRAVYEA